MRRSELFEAMPAWNQGQTCSPVGRSCSPDSSQRQLKSFRRQYRILVVMNQHPCTCGVCYYSLRIQNYVLLCSANSNTILLSGQPTGKSGLVLAFMAGYRLYVKRWALTKHDSELKIHFLQFHKSTELPVSTSTLFNSRNADFLTSKKYESILFADAGNLSALRTVLCWCETYQPDIWWSGDLSIWYALVIVDNANIFACRNLRRTDTRRLAIDGNSSFLFRKTRVMFNTRNHLYSDMPIIPNSLDAGNKGWNWW